MTWEINPHPTTPIRMRSDGLRAMPAFSLASSVR